MDGGVQVEGGGALEQDSPADSVLLVQGESSTEALRRVAEEDDVFIRNPRSWAAQLEPGVAERIFGVEAGGVGAEDEIVVIVPLGGYGAGPSDFEVDVGRVVETFDEDVAVVG